MDDTQPEPSSREKMATDTDIRSDSPSEDFKPVGQMDVNVGDFTRTQGLLKSLRLTLNNQIVVPVEEIASGINEAGRSFKLGDIELANQEVSRLYSNFGRKINQWESQARNLEQQMRMQAAKNPKSVSIDTMNRMKSEQIAVRTRIRSTEVQFRRLHLGLDQIFTNLKRPTEGATLDASVELPAAFLATFKVAPVAERPQVVKDCFDIESILTVKVSRRTQGDYGVKFDPKPPINRLYFLTKTAQAIRLQQLAKVVLIEDLETGQTSEMGLADFVKHVQSGTWLLKPRS